LNCGAKCRSNQPNNFTLLPLWELIAMVKKMLFWWPHIALLLTNQMT
jgi:hypothetical protein